MNSLSTGKLADALAKIGRDTIQRERMVDFLKKVDKNITVRGVSVREEVTGPIVDALYLETDIIKKILSSGLEISCKYRSKIARDFVMAESHPDYVWEPQTTKLILSLGKETKQVIIGGAYFGDQAIPLAHAIKSRGGLCHCFEVNSDQLKMLKFNAKANKLDNMIFNQTGLWKDSTSRLTLSGDDSHAYSREAKNDDSFQDTFPAITINEYGAKHGLRHINLITLDIEGGEFAALQGAENYLEQPVDKAPNLIFEIHRSYIDWSHGLRNTDIIRFLEKKGYLMFAIRDYQGNVPMKRRPIEIVPIDNIYLEGLPHGFNMLAIKNRDLIKRHNLKICPGVSPKLLFHRDPKLHQPLH